MAGNQKQGTAYLLFGCRSPLVVDYEESLLRNGDLHAASVSLGDTPRVLDHSKVVAIESMAASTLLSDRDALGFITCAFSSERRRELSAMALSLGLRAAPALVDTTAVLPRSIRLGHGSFINAAAVIGGATLIGSHTLVNRAVSIGHHCMIGDFVSIAPGVTLTSNVKVGDGATIGAGAVVVPNITIGDGAVIGAGSLIRTDIAAGEFWAGNPAKQRELNINQSALNTAGEE